MWRGQEMGNVMGREREGEWEGKTGKGKGNGRGEKIRVMGLPLLYLTSGYGPGGEHTWEASQKSPLFCSSGTTAVYDWGGFVSKPRHGSWKCEGKSPMGPASTESRSW